MTAAERSRRYRLRKKIEKYGPASEHVDMRGRHGNHASGVANGRYNAGRLTTSHGYVLVRVPKEHPHAFGPPTLRGAYAYKHMVVAMRHLGRSLRSDEVVHHINGNKADNRWRNLLVTTRAAHARGHVSVAGARDARGRFTKGAR